MKRTILALLLSLTMAAGMMAGCGSTAGQTEDATETAGSAETAAEAAEADTEAAEEDEENYETGDATLDDTRNQDEIGDKELLVVSFGTSYNDSRRLTIGAIENAIAEACPDYSVRRGFTSQIIIDHVKSRDNVTIDNVTEALDRAVDNGVKTLVVQPTHLMNGLEYTDLVNEIAQYADAFDQVSIGEPLLTSEEDFKAVAQAIVDATAEYDDGKTAICFMGHGTEAESNQVYAQMQDVLLDMGYENYYVGTVEATPSLDDVLNLVEESDYERVVLEPLMVVAGDHANNDMAGDDPDSWKSTFEAAGYEVVTLVRGLGELKPIQQLYVQHAQAAIEESLTPVYATELKDGTYDIEMTSSSSMFKVDRCELQVDNGSMQAVLYMTSQSYLYLYAGTAAEAAAADEADYIYREDAGDGMGSYTLPIEALDDGISCAAYSKKNEKWYDRTLLFHADSLPQEAFVEARGTSAADLGLEDGSYTVAVTLDGGSGRASVTSPAALTVAGGNDTVTLAWSSPNYDYMVVDGVRYDPVNTDGNSVFEIPLTTLDTPIAVQADTTAMSQPYLIDYTLTFDAASIVAAE